VILSRNTGSPVSQKINKREGNERMESYKIYISGELVAAFYSQSKFKIEVVRLEAKYNKVFNAPHSFLQSNVKTR